MLSRIKLRAIKAGVVALGIVLLLVPFITRNHIYQGVALGLDSKVFAQFITDLLVGFLGQPQFFFQW